MSNINRMIEDTRISTLLFCGCIQGDLNIVKEVFEKYQNIFEIAIEDAFIHSVSNGQIEIIKYLLETPCKYYDLNKVLVHAAKEGQLEIFKLLEKEGANIHYDGDISFIESAKNGRLNIVKYLLVNGTDIHIHSDMALRMAAKHNHFEVVKFLVENGANIHAKNDEALMLSAHHSFIEQLEYLLSKGGKKEIAEKAARNEAKLFFLAKSLDENLDSKPKLNYKAKI